MVENQEKTDMRCSILSTEKTIGNYIVDFYCPKGKLILEIDGSQHYERRGRKKDQKRDDYLQNLNLTVLRFSDIDVSRNYNRCSRKDP